jgi:flagellar motor switch/type III secretory pathway protein FliN
MAAAQPLPANATEPAGETLTSAASETADTSALLQPPVSPAAEGLIAPASPLSRLPVEVDVTIPVPAFRVRTLLAMAPGQVIETEWIQGEDMPLAAGDVQLAWTEFEVIETALAVRVTRLV